MEHRDLVWAGGWEFDDRLLGPPDLRDAREKDQAVPIDLTPRLTDRLRDGEWERGPLAHRAPPGLHRIGAPFAYDHRRLTESGRDRGRVERRGHHDEAEILAEHGAGLEGERQPEIGGQVPLVELIEADGGDAVQPRILLQHPREDPLGHDLDAGACSDLAVVPHAVAHRLARALAE